MTEAFFFPFQKVRSHSVAKGTVLIMKVEAMAWVKRQRGQARGRMVRRDGAEVILSLLLIT